jgi:hypothetical protein
MSITFPERVIVRTIGTIIASAYIAVILAALLLGPLVLLHGYRAWWLVIFYAGTAVAVIGGLISRRRFVGQGRAASLHPEGQGLESA